VRDACAATEIPEVGATAHTDVLAMVDPLAGGGIAVRSGPAAQPATGLEKLDPQTVPTQGRRGSQPGQSATHDTDAHPTRFSQ
jgi:hypothetical protein